MHHIGLDYQQESTVTTLLIKYHRADCIVNIGLFVVALLTHCRVMLYFKVRLVDAGFVWTEPHSKRIKVKLTIQKEVC